jgi:hypothetical protein
MVKGLEVDLLMNSAASYLKFPPLPPSPVSQDADTEEDPRTQHPARLALVAIDRYIHIHIHIYIYGYIYIYICIYPYIYIYIYIILWY